MLKPNRKNQINTAIENNAQPYRSRKDALILRLGNKSYARLQDGNTLTPAGAHYFERTGKEVPCLLYTSPSPRDS